MGVWGLMTGEDKARSRHVHGYQGDSGIDIGPRSLLRDLQVGHRLLGPFASTRAFSESFTTRAKSAPRDATSLEEGDGQEVGQVPHPEENS